MNKKKALAPSLFAADFSDLKSALIKMEESGVDLIHYDVMDNHFVPNISFGSKVIADLARQTSIPGDVHLMINLEKGIEPYLKLPVEYVTLHLEATPFYLRPYLEQIKESGKKVGVSLRPHTPIQLVEPFLKDLDLVLLMSVEPGFSGQKFKSETLDRIRELRKLKGADSVLVQVDGGVNRENFISLLEAGADILVAGSAFFRDENPKEWVEEVHSFAY